MNNHSATIFVRTRFDATHYWPEPTAGRAYLGDVHHHTFHFEAQATVTHDDRDIEFHDLKASLHQAVLSLVDKHPNTPYTFGPRSCEMIGAELLDILPLAVFSVTVQEDEDCGAVVLRGNV